MKNFFVILSALLLLTVTSCDKYVLSETTISDSLAVFNTTMSEYAAALEQLHSLEIQQETAVPEAKDSLAKQMDSLFLEMSALIGKHESTRVALETLTGKTIMEITPEPVLVSGHRLSKAMNILRNTSTTMKKEDELLRQLKSLMPIGKNVADMKKSERKLASFQAYYGTFAQILQSLRPEPKGLVPEPEFNEKTRYPVPFSVVHPI